MQSNQLTLELCDITFAYDDMLLFSNLSLTLSSQKIIQLIGANGMGKSSVLRILAGLIRPSRGDLLCNGKSIYKDLTHYQAGLFYLGHQIGVYSHLTVYENLQLDPRLVSCNKSQIEAGLNLFGLTEKVGVIADTLSRGQKQKLALVKVWLAEYAIYLLDEPFSTLDSEALSLTKRMIQDKQRQGALVILTAHYPQGVSDFIVRLEEMMCTPA